MDNYKISPVGDQSILIVFGDRIDESINKQVTALTAELRLNPINGLVDVIPAFSSILINYDPLIIGYKHFVKKVESLLNNLSTSEKREKRIFEIPVCYGSKFGEDIAFVASNANLTEQEVIEIHSNRDYLIYMLGFLPGFSYLGGMDPRIESPRLNTPRISIPSGSVGIGGMQTGVYPMESPAGWQLIGRTPLKPFDLKRQPAILYEAGDYIRFIPIDEDEYYRIELEINAGTYKYIMRKEDGSLWE